jgi:hypothetical protein
MGEGIQKELEPEVGIASTKVRHDKMEHWLREWYKTLTFNTCEHSRLPVMMGPLLELHIKPDMSQSSATTQYWCPSTGESKSRQTWTETNNWELSRRSLMGHLTHGY